MIKNQVRLTSATFCWQLHAIISLSKLGNLAAEDAQQGLMTTQGILLASRYFQQ